PFRRVTETSSTAGPDGHRVAGGDRMSRHLAHLARNTPRIRNDDLGACTGAAAPEAQWRSELPLERERTEGRDIKPIHALDSEAAAEFALAAGIRSQPIFQHANVPVARLRDFDWIVARVRRGDLAQSGFAIVM